MRPHVSIAIETTVIDSVDYQRTDETIRLDIRVSGAGVSVLEWGDQSGRQRLFFCNLFFRRRGHARQNIHQRHRPADRETLEVIYFVPLQPLQYEIVFYMFGHRSGTQDFGDADCGGYNCL